MNAASLLRNFETEWSKCAGMDNPETARQFLLKQIVKRVYVRNRQVVGIELFKEYAVVLGLPLARTHDVARKLVSTTNPDASSAV